MNTQQMNLNAMRSALKAANRVGNFFLIDLLEEQIDSITARRGHGTQRGGKRELTED